MRSISLVCSLAAVSLAIAAAAPPAATPSKGAQQVAALAPQALAWIKQEAQRELTANTLSESAAAQAVGRSGLYWGSMSIEDIVVLVMREAQQDADNELRQMLASAQQARAQKQAMRRSAVQQQRAQASGQAREGIARQQPPAALAHSAALDDYLASRHMGYESLTDMTQEQQIRLQVALDRRSKAAQILSNIQKKASDTSQGIIQNMK